MKVYQVMPNGAEALIVDTNSLSTADFMQDPMQVIYAGVYRYSEKNDFNEMLNTLMARIGQGMPETEKQALLIIVKV